jgi:hypothetical protein
MVLDRGVTFEEFAMEQSARLRAGPVAAYGPEVGGGSGG